MEVRGIYRNQSNEHGQLIRFTFTLTVAEVAAQEHAAHEAMMKRIGRRS